MLCKKRARVHTLLCVSLLCASSSPLAQVPDLGPEVTAARLFGQSWAPADEAVFTEALQLAGLTRDDFGFKPGITKRWGGDRYVLPTFEHYFHNVWDISAYARQSAKTAISFGEDPVTTAYLGQSVTGFRARDSIYSTYIARAQRQVREQGQQALAIVLSELGAGSLKEIIDLPGYADVPPEVAHAAALLLRQIMVAEGLRDVAVTERVERLGRAPAEVFEQEFAEIFLNTTLDDEAPSALHSLSRDIIQQEELIEAVDFPSLYRGANTLMLGIRHAMRELDGESAKRQHVARLREDAPRDENGKIIDQGVLDVAIKALRMEDFKPDLTNRFFSFEVNTDLGWVRLHGVQDNKYLYDAQSHDLLVIDTGGNDTYQRAATTTSMDYAIGVVIDLSGDDSYVSPDFADWDTYSKSVDGRGDDFVYHKAEDHYPAVAAGLFGYAVLFDMQGNDRYASPFFSLGAARFGFAMLHDAAGDDSYTADTFSQGAGTFGTGILHDLAGDDKYLCFSHAQAFGGTLGSGLLLDLDGNDDYHAVNARSKAINGYTVKYAWFNEHPNALSMSQGFGYGRRADMADGHSMAGGQGVLIDAGEGDDTYDAGIFSQGSAYWYALGVLYDDGGDDSYSTSWYSLASPPHFAVGVVIDEAGDDVYRGHDSRAFGFGRDLSIGWFEDAAGNDRYYGNDSAFGVGNVNGLGVFWDKSGDDVYIARSNSFGQPFVEGPQGTIRDLIINAGLFIDGGGEDIYKQISSEQASFINHPFEWKDGESLEPLRLKFADTSLEMRDGARVSWRGLFEGRPGSTGAALDIQDEAHKEVD